MTNQEIFDRVARHLLTQNAKSKSPDGCRYRGPDNTKCAIGCLIPDEAYTPNMEGGTLRVRPSVIQALYQAGLTPDQVSIRQSGFLSHLDGSAASLLRSLQCVHDEFLPDYWPTGLIHVAKLHALSDAVIDEFLDTGASVC